MPTPIFVSPPAAVPRWEITYHNDDLSLIRFVKWGRTTKLLDQVARWSGNRWDPARWVPTDRAVPKDIMRQVVGRLRQEAAALAITREPEFPGQVVWECGTVLGIARDEATAHAAAAACREVQR